MVSWKTLALSATCNWLATSANLQHEDIAQQFLSKIGFSSGKKSNIVFVLTDDQDLHMNSLDYMPYGTFFHRHYCTIALCCPSRVSLWTGRAAHNTNVTDVYPPYGGYPKFVSQGFNEAYLPVWLQQAGYQTYYVGKLFNSHSLVNWNSPFPAGFTGSDFLLDPHTYEHLNATFQRNQGPPVSREGEYSTDILAGKAYGFLDDAVKSGQPFFLTVAPNVPHSNVKFHENFFNGNISANTVETSPPIPAKRHAKLFKDVKIPRTPNFNPDTAHGVCWVSTLPKQNQSNLDYNDRFYRNRLRALQAVDEIVDGLFIRLEDYGVLDNTYFFYSSDNGYHIRQHRLQPGKECGFEEDINVSLIVRRPGVPSGLVSDLVTSHTDLAPTFLELAGGEIRTDFDGSAIPIHSSLLEDKSRNRGEHVNIEYWGFTLAEGKFNQYSFWNNTYKGLRLIGEDYNFYYSVWCSGEHELYDLNTDPYETTNLYTTNHTSTIHFSSNSKRTNLTHLLARLDALILVLKTCQGRVCTHPGRRCTPQATCTIYTTHCTSNTTGSTRSSKSACNSSAARGAYLDSEGPVFAGG